MITYREFGPEAMIDVRRMAQSCGWDLYLLDWAQTCRAFARSLLCLGAFEDKRLVGYIRCTGDGEFTVHVEDVMVDEAYRCRGIGHQLLREAEKRFPQVDMITLIADKDDEGLGAFYRSAGFQAYEEKALIGFARQVRQ